MHPHFFSVLYFNRNPFALTSSPDARTQALVSPCKACARGLERMWQPVQERRGMPCAGTFSEIAPICHVGSLPTLCVRHKRLSAHKNNTSSQHACASTAAFEGKRASPAKCPTRAAEKFRGASRCSGSASASSVAWSSVSDHLAWSSTISLSSGSYACHGAIMVIF